MEAAGCPCKQQQLLLPLFLKTQITYVKDEFPTMNHMDAVRMTECVTQYLFVKCLMDYKHSFSLICWRFHCYLFTLLLDLKSF